MELGMRQAGVPHPNGLHRSFKLVHSKLQSKGTQRVPESAKRLLTRRKRKEARFAKDVNHQIAKQIINHAKDTAPGRPDGGALWARERVTVRKAQRRQHNAWSFHDLRAKLEYKAQLHGIPFVLVDRRNTSKACNACGCIDSANRKDQATFLCVSCGGFPLGPANADTNAALNIRGRATVNWPHVSTSASRPLGTSPLPLGVGS